MADASESGEMSRNSVYKQAQREAESRALAAREQEIMDKAAAEQLAQVPRKEPPLPPSVMARAGQSPDQVQAREAAQQAPAPEPPEGVTEDPLVKSVLRTIGGAKEISATVGTGIAEALDETVDTAKWAWSSLVRSEEQYKDTQFFSSQVMKPETAAGELLSPFVQFAMPFGAGMKVANSVRKGAQFAKGMGVGALVDAGAFDPYEGRLSTLMNEVPALEGVVPDWLASNDPEDPEWEARFKMALEGSVYGVAAEGAFRVVRAGIGRIRTGRAERGLIGTEGAEFKETSVEDAAVSARVASEVASNATNARRTGPEEASQAKKAPAKGSKEQQEALKILQEGPREARKKRFAEKQRLAREERAKQEEVRRGKLTDEERAAEDQQKEVDKQLASARKAVKSHANQMAEEQHTTWKARPEMPENLEPDIGDWLRARGVEEDKLETRMQNMATVERVLTMEHPTTKQAALEVFLDEPEGSLLGDTLTWMATREMEPEETAMFMTSVRSYAPRMAPKDVAEVLRGLQGRMAMQSARAAETGTGAVQASNAYLRMSRSIEDLHSAPESAERMQIALDLADETVSTWNPDAEIAAPLSTILTSSAKGDPMSRLKGKQFIEVTKETPAEVRAAAPPSFGTHAGDRFWAWNRPEYFEQKPSSAGVLGGALRAPTPVYIRFGDLDRVEDIASMQQRFNAARGSPEEFFAEPIGRARARSEAAIAEEAEAIVPDESWMEGLTGDPLADLPASIRAQLSESDLRNLMQVGMPAQPAAQQPAVAQQEANLDDLKTADEVRDGEGRLAEAEEDADIAARRTPEPEAPPESVQEASTRLAMEIAQRQAAVSSLDSLLQETVPQPMRMRLNPINPEEAPAQLDMMLSAGQTVHQLARMATGPHATPHVRNSFLASLYRYDALAHKVKGDSAGAQRLLDAAKEVQDGGVESIGKHGGNLKVSALAAAVDETGSMEAGMRLMRDWKRPDRASGWAGTIHQLRTASMLSSPFTHARNITGNAVPAVLELPQQFWTSMRAHGTRNPLDDQVLEDVQMRFAGMVWGSRKGWQLMKADLGLAWRGAEGREAIELRMKEQNVDWIRRDFAQGTKWDPGLPLDSDEAVRELNETMQPGRWFGEKGRRALEENRLLKSPLAMLQTEDMYFKSVNYFGEVFYRAGKQARQEGLTGQDLRNRVEEIVTGHQAGDDLHAHGMNTAEQNTFTNDLTGWSANLQPLLTKWNQLPRWIVPFYKTPVNILKTEVRYTPGLNFMLKEVRDNWRKGGEDWHKEQARMMTGAVLAGASWGLVESGRVTGSGRAHGYRQRAEPASSIKIGDTWYPYSYIPIVGAHLGVLAEAHELQAAAQTDEEIDAADHIMGLAQAIVGRGIEASWVGDTMDFFETIGSEGVGKGDKAIRYLMRQIQPMVPFQGARRDTARIMDRGMREEMSTQSGAGGDEEDLGEKMVEEFHRLVKETFPASSRWFGNDERFPVRNLYGRPETRIAAPDAFVNGEWTEFPKVFVASLPPVAWEASADDPLSKEITDLGMSFSRAARKHAFKHLDQVSGWEYTPKQYDRYSRLRGELFYRYGSEEVRRGGWDDLTAKKKRLLIRRAMTDATQHAKIRMEADFPVIKQEQAKFEQRAIRAMEG